MITCLTSRTVVRCFLMQRVPALVCVLALVLGVTMQGAMAGTLKGLRRVGREYHAKDIKAVLAGFAAMPGWSEVPGAITWLMPEPGAKSGDKFKGGMGDSPEEIIAYFRTLPAARTALGIFITGEITYLEDPEASKELMTEHQETLLARPEWVAGRRKSIEALVAACEREKIEVWVNVNLGGKDLRFRKLTK